MIPEFEIRVGDALAVLRTLESDRFHCAVTSPPYWALRDYGVEGQMGVETTPQEYLLKMTAVFDEVRRTLRPDGTLWMNMGDCYASSTYGSGGGWAKNGDAYQDAPKQSRSLFKDPGYKALLPVKNLVGMPWRLALALQASGWTLRCDIIWSKPNPMPESVRDRPTKSHEYVFLMTKSARYWYDADAVREPHSSIPPGIENESDAWKSGEVYANEGVFSARRRQKSRPATYFGNANGRNIRSVWTIQAMPFPGSHFATFPLALAERCIKAGCPPEGEVLDPFAGAGTTLLAARLLGRKSFGIELNPEYAAMARHRVATMGEGREPHPNPSPLCGEGLPLFAEVAGE